MKRIAVLALLCIACVGCNDPYGASSKAGADIASGITSAMNMTAGLQKQGTISTQEALNVLGYFEFANRADEAFLSCVRLAHTNGNKVGTYTACASTFNTALNTPADLALIKVGNSAALNDINLAVKSITDAVNAILSGLGGA